MKICNACNGTGIETTKLENDMILLDTEVNCQVCNGSGILTDDYHFWYMQMLNFMNSYLKGGVHE